MKFTIHFTPNALDHLRGFDTFEQKVIMEAIKTQLFYEPLTQTKNRKPLRQNPLSRWELRVINYRVFYDVDQENRVVEIKAIGAKEHNQLFLGGKEFEL
jgi:mRNA-degrading endonuclease RelE of RelBE toxin-antitoxin system